MLDPAGEKIESKIYKIYAESFLSEDHLRQLQQEAQNFMKALFKST